MKHDFRGWLGLCTMVNALHVMAVSIRAGRLGVGKLMISEAACVVLRSFSPVGESEHSEIACGEEEGFYDAPVQ